MIEYPLIERALLFFFIVSLIGMTFYYLSRKPGKRHAEKESIYTCGEDMEPEELNIPAETFYEYLIDIFKLKKLREWHSGILNDYLLWIFAGTLLIIAILMVMM